MKLESVSKNLIFLSVINKTSQKGNNFQLVELADKEEFEKFEFFLGDELDLDGLVLGESVQATIKLEKRGFNIQPQLVKLEKLKVKANV